MTNMSAQKKVKSTLGKVRSFIRIATDNYVYIVIYDITYICNAEYNNDIKALFINIYLKKGQLK